MNETDHYVIKAIQGYYDIHGKYPPRVEVSEDLRCQMTQKSFVFAEITPLLHSGTVPPSGAIKRVEIPVVPVGDDIAMSFFVEHISADPEYAKMGAEKRYKALYQKFSREGIDFAIVNSHYKKHHMYPWSQYYCIEGVIYGHECVLDKIKKNEEQQK